MIFFLEAVKYRKQFEVRSRKSYEDFLYSGNNILALPNPKP